MSVRPSARVELAGNSQPGRFIANLSFLPRTRTLSGASDGRVGEAKNTCNMRDRRRNMQEVNYQKFCNGFTVTRFIGQSYLIFFEDVGPLPTDKQWPARSSTSSHAKRRAGGKQEPAIHAYQGLYYAYVAFRVPLCDSKPYTFKLSYFTDNSYLCNFIGTETSKPP